MRRVLMAMLMLLLVAGCTEEQQNKLSRVGVTWMEGNYIVTYADGAHVKAWKVYGGKVTAEPEKGYYYFWAREEPKSKKRYVQTPILRTYIEEMP